MPGAVSAKSRTAAFAPPAANEQDDQFYVRCIETVCMTTSKGLNSTFNVKARGGSIHDDRGNCESLVGEKGKMWSVMAAGIAYERDMRTDFRNHLVRYVAEENNYDKAQDWMETLDARKGFVPELRSVHALIRSAMQSRDLDSADEWFTKLLEPKLHPELAGLEPDIEIFDTMIRTCAEVGDIGRSEKYLQAMRCWRDGSARPALRSWVSVIKCCCEGGEARRGHRWLESLVNEGSNEFGDYKSASVCEERMRFSSMRRFDLDAFDALVKFVIRSLVDIGHTITSNLWLNYLVETGTPPESDPDIWEHVRTLHPPEIVPLVLSGEMPNNIPGSPGRTSPATLSGEMRVRGAMRCSGSPRLPPLQDGAVLAQSSPRVAGFGGTPPWLKLHLHAKTSGAVMNAGWRDAVGVDKKAANAEVRFKRAKETERRRQKLHAVVLS